MINALRSLILLLCGLLPAAAQAHGERAQMPQLRMSTVHWFDVNLSTTKLNVNDLLVVKGSFMPSLYWPEHIASIEGTAFLNIGVPGPTFVRLDSRVNGVPMIRSTRFMKGELYHFEITLKARIPGRYHLHPLINVEGTGPIIGPGQWIDVGGNAADFRLTAKTLLGEEIDLEHYGFANAAAWSALWFAVGLAWFGYWLLKCPIVVPRFKRRDELGPIDADLMITHTDRKIGVIFLALTLSLIVGGYQYAQASWPITTPLQTGRVDVPLLEQPAPTVQVKLVEARYRIPGRSFRMELSVTNTGSSPVTVGEMAAGNLRFVNSSVLKVSLKDEDDLVASDSLRVENGPVMPGETKTIVIYADDALWETQRMTTMIKSPDAAVAALLFFFDEQGGRHLVEIGGPMIPVFG
ncbi:MAG: bacterial ammonia monooxygenase, subunit AmoB [Panacagrimonas sp.]